MSTSPIEQDLLLPFLKQLGAVLLGLTNESAQVLA